jgi:hypothetical protein
MIKILKQETLNRVSVVTGNAVYNTHSVVVVVYPDVHYTTNESVKKRGVIEN